VVVPVDPNYAGLTDEDSADQWVAALKGEVESIFHHLPTVQVPVVAGDLAPAPEGAPRAMFTLAYWKYVAERSIKTFIQTMIAMLGIGQTGMISVDWQKIAAVAASAALVSVMTSMSVLNGSAPAASPVDEAPIVG
jgi:hypothetical protein